MKKRYERNMLTLSKEENERLKDFRVCVVGCGGLGGHVIEQLGRLGVGHLTAIDGDVFEESNLNRQILSDESALGKSKAAAAKARMEKVNSDVNVRAVRAFLTAENSDELLKGHDVVVDALDNIISRRVLEKGASDQNIPLVHGAIAGWYGQVSVILPGTRAFDALYPEKAGENAERGIEREIGTPAFTPAAVASIQVAEILKLLLNRGSGLAGRLLTINLLDHEYELFEIGAERV